MPPPPVASAPVPSPVEEASTPTRPTIKLKHGAPNKAAEGPKNVPKAKGRKVQAIDAPPPPYIDDGSHDLLQEVIAMEKEKGEKRPRSTSVKDRAPEKRKKPSTGEDVDDDILALAPPISSKKKNPTLAIDTSKNGVSPKPSPTPHTSKRDSAPEPLAAQPSTIRISVKGKEKEAASSSASATSKPHRSSPAQSIPINDKKCRDLLKNLLKLPEAAIFSRPVDADLDGCPT